MATRGGGRRRLEGAAPRPRQGKTEENRATGRVGRTPVAAGGTGGPNGGGDGQGTSGGDE